MATALLHAPEEYIPNESYFQQLIDKSGTKGSAKILDFKQQYNKLLNKFKGRGITFNQYFNRVNKISDRLNNYTRSISKFTPPSHLRNRFSNDTGGEDIELFNRGETGSSYGSTSSTSGVQLLEDSVAGGSVVESTTSLAPIVSVGFGGIAAATGAGILSKVYNSGIQVPGTKYVGPGNVLDSGKPTSQVDEDARDHDISYSQSSDPEHISKSDQHTINKFGDHFAEDNSDITALIGHVGLQLKKTVEKHTGQLYPSKYG